MRVAIAFDNFGPYHVARIKAAATYVDVLAVEVHASSDEYAWVSPERPHGLQYTNFLGNGRARSDWARLISAYEQKVAPWRPDAIALPGWSSAAALAGLWWSLKRRVPAILMSETNAMDAPRHFVGEFVKRRLIGLFRAALCGGSLARSYALGLGLAEECVFLGYDVVDNAYFEQRAAAAREGLRLPPGVEAGSLGRYFLACARFVPKKNLLRLLKAYSRYRAIVRDEPWPLVLVGDGPLRAEIERERSALGLEASVLLPGFVQYDGLPLFLGGAGAFVIASTTEQWGLVTNEAMAAGLPVIVSNRCGCAVDLVEEGRNGHTFDPLDTERLATLLAKVSGPECDRASMGQASREIIARWSPDTFGKGMAGAARAAIASPASHNAQVHKALLWLLAHR